MPGASRAITLLLVGTGIAGTGYEVSQRGPAYDDDNAIASTQPSSTGYHTGYTGSHHWYNSFFHSSGYYSSPSFSSHHFSSSHSSSSTSRGGFGSTGHAHASSSG